MQYRFIAIFLLTLFISACGWTLQGAIKLPFSQAQLSSQENSTLRSELSKRLSTEKILVSNAKLKDAPVIELLEEAKERTVSAVSAQGRVREVQLKHRVKLRVLKANQSVWLDAVALEQVRTLAFTENEILAKQYEEAGLYQEMQTELTRLILQRLANLPQ